MTVNSPLSSLRSPPPEGGVSRSGRPFPTDVKITILLASVAGTCAAASMYDQPYALFEPERAHPAADTRPAMIMKIDGRDRAVNRNDPVTPGKHTVELSVPGRTGMSNPSRDTLTVDAQPCTRYFFAARRSSMTASDWQAFVAATEPIGDCARKFLAK